MDKVVTQCRCQKWMAASKDQGHGAARRGGQTSRGQPVGLRPGQIDDQRQDRRIRHVGPEQPNAAQLDQGRGLRRAVQVVICVDPEPVIRKEPGALRHHLQRCSGFATSRGAEHEDALALQDNRRAAAEMPPPGRGVA